MPRIYLSPSTQENNFYVTGGTEEQYMNLLADQIVPYLDANAVAYTRNDPNLSAAAAIRQANAGSYDLYVALHSNAAPEGQYGSKRGIDIYYFPGSMNSRRAAQLFAEQMKTVYPLPQSVRIVPTTTLGEVTRTRAPAVLLELGFHDNVSDANWVKENLPSIARAVSLAIMNYFDLPLANPQPIRNGIVTVSSGRLNIRSRPATTSRVLTSVPDDTPLIITGTLPQWYVIRYGSIAGYVSRSFVKVL